MSRFRFGAAVLASAFGLLGVAVVSATTAAGAAERNTSTTTRYPLTINNCGMKETFTKPPTRVEILNGSSVAEVESFIALGLQKSIVANTQSYGVSDDPSMVAAIKAIPTRGLTLNKNYDVPAEETLGIRPDLVVSTWYGGFDQSDGFASRSQLARAGINSLVNPSNCANGNAQATPAEQTAYTHQSISSSYEFLTLLGQIFNVQKKAASVIAASEASISSIEHKVAGLSRPHVLVVFPGMSAMNAAGVPQVFGGGIYDSIIAAAGGVDSFERATNAQLAAINKEALTAAKVDVLVIGLFTPTESATLYAKQLFTEFPTWSASKTKTWTTVSDSIYLGPLNAIAVEKIAKLAHPSAFRE